MDDFTDWAKIYAAEGSDSSINSYEKAIINSDALWEWNTSGNETREVPVTKESGPEQKPPTHIGNRDMANTGASNSRNSNKLKGDRNVPSGAGIVRADDTKVQVGFFPTTTPLDTTNPTELPGSRRPVITAPPGSKVIGERPRAKSIEEANSRNKNYAPGMTKNPIPGKFRDDSGVCLGLASYLSSSVPDSGDSGRGSSVAKKSFRKASLAPSTTSVSIVCVFKILFMRIEQWHVYPT